MSNCLNIPLPEPLCQQKTFRARRASRARRLLLTFAGMRWTLHDRGDIEDQRDGRVGSAWPTSALAYHPARAELGERHQPLLLLGARRYRTIADGRHVGRGAALLPPKSAAGRLRRSMVTKGCRTRGPKSSAHDTSGCAWCCSATPSTQGPAASRRPPGRSIARAIRRFYRDASSSGELAQRLRRPRRLRAGVCHRPRDRSSRPEPDGIDGRASRDRQAFPRARRWRSRLQADCFAGVWGHAASQPGRFQAGGVELEPGDAEGSAACRRRDRRRPAAEDGHGARDAGALYPRIVGAAGSVVQTGNGLGRSACVLDGARPTTF